MGAKPFVSCNYSSSINPIFFYADFKSAIEAKGYKIKDITYIEIMDAVSAINKYNEENNINECVVDCYAKKSCSAYWKMSFRINGECVHDAYIFFK